MLFSFILRSIVLAPTASATLLYVSSYVGNITTLSLTSSNGAYRLSQLSTIPGGPSPSFLTQDLYSKVIYNVNEALDGGNGTITAFTSKAGVLTQIDSVNTLNSPVHSSVYNNGKALVVAHYGTSAVTTWKISSTGTLSPLQTFVFTMAKPGPNAGRQDRPHCHETIVDPTGNYILVPDLGADLVHIFSIDPSTSKLTKHNSLVVVPGTGPRHGAFVVLPTGTYFYLVSELGVSVTAFDVGYLANDSGMTFTKISNQTLDGPGHHNFGAGAEAVVSPDGKFLLTSNRFDAPFTLAPSNAYGTISTETVVSDSLEVFAINQVTGDLAFKQLYPAGGAVPRQFSINKAGTLAAVALEPNDAAKPAVVIVARDPITGLYTKFVASIELEDQTLGEVTCVIWDE